VASTARKLHSFWPTKDSGVAAAIEIACAMTLAIPRSVDQGDQQHVAEAEGDQETVKNFAPGALGGRLGTERPVAVPQKLFATETTNDSTAATL